MMVSLLDEGAGDIEGKAFHELLERKAIELGFSAGRDTIRGTLRTLKENQDEAFELLRLAMTAPRFGTPPVASLPAALVARPRFTMKFACVAETSASPTRSPFSPLSSIRRPAEFPGGFLKMQPALGSRGCDSCRFFA